MGSLVISVSAGTGCYRHIQISKKATLHKLHEAIIAAFDFDDDHLYIFFMDNHYWSHNNVYVREKIRTTDRLAKNCKLEKLNFSKGDQFKYIFDLGDEWRFQCKVLREIEEETLNPIVIRKVGASPEQYPDFDDEWDDEDDDWDDLDEEFIEQNLLKHFAELRESISLEDSTIHLIGEYVEAAGNLYGLISLFALSEIYNSQNEPVTDMEFMTAALLGSTTYISCTLHTRDDLPQDTPEQALIAYEVAADYLFVDDEDRDIRQLRQQQRGKPLKILPKEAFLKYADPNYWPDTQQRRDMIRYLTNRRSELAYSPEEFCDAFQRMLVCDAPLNEVLVLAEADGLRFNRKQDIGEFMAFYQKLNNATHKHANRGHTPDELFAMSDRGKKLAEQNNPENQLSFFDKLTTEPGPSPKPRLTIVGTPSRNAPCPCGSGRKYKNCCGNK